MKWPSSWHVQWHVQWYSSIFFKLLRQTAALFIQAVNNLEGVYILFVEGGRWLRLSLAGRDRRQLCKRNLGSALYRGSSTHIPRRKTLQCEVLHSEIKKNIALNWVKISPDFGLLYTINYGPLTSSTKSSAQSISDVKPEVFWTWAVGILKMDVKGNG